MSEPYYRRQAYIDAIQPYLGKNIIKVIIGMRRVGKSYFLKQLKDDLFAQGLNEAHFLLIDKENVRFDNIRNYQDLASFVESHFKNVSGKKVLFVDEVQEIENWERAIRSFFNDGDIDIVITGSNAQLLSSEIATFLAGRTIEFTMYPLSFAEFLDFNKIQDVAQGFREYLRFGGMPTIYDLHLSDSEKRFDLLRSLYNTIILKDVIARHNIRNIHMIENLVRYVFDNIGNIFSAKKICDYLKSQKQSLTVDTALTYIRYLEAACAIHKASRIDLKGKRLLEVSEKYYVADLGIRHAVIGYKENDVGNILENVIYLFLKNKGYTVYVGKWADTEIDFVAERGGNRIYIQVAYLLASKETIQREFAPLHAIEDNFPKFVLSLDESFSQDIKGIQWMNIRDFLLGANP